MIRRFFPAAVTLSLCSLLAGACGGSGGDSEPPPPDPCVDAGMAGPPPVARSGMVGAVDISTNSMFLFGGDMAPSCGAASGHQLLNDTWHFETVCKRWDQLSPTMSPPARSGAAFAIEFKA